MALERTRSLARPFAAVAQQADLIWASKPTSIVIGPSGRQNVSSRRLSLAKLFLFVLLPDSGTRFRIEFVYLDRNGDLAAHYLMNCVKISYWPRASNLLSLCPFYIHEQDDRASYLLVDF